MLPVNDTPTWLDIQRGGVSASGPVGVSLLRKDPSDWLAGYTITIHAAEGGGIKLAEPDDDLMFEAPADGYQPKVRIEQPPGDVYSKGKKIRLYVRTPDQKYAALSMEMVQFNNRPALMDVGFYLNPSGSRSLQYREDLRLPTEP